MLTLVQCFQLSLHMATFVVFATTLCKTVIMKAFILKLGENIGTSFLFSLANLGRSSLSVYVYYHKITGYHVILVA